MTIFYQLHSVLIREKLYVTTDRKGTYTCSPRGVLQIGRQYSVPVTTDEIASERQETVLRNLYVVKTDEDTQTAWTEYLTPSIKDTIKYGGAFTLEGEHAVNLLGEWWLLGFSATPKEGKEYIKYHIDHDRQTYATTTGPGITIAGMATLGWLTCLPWLIISPTWEAYTLES